MRAAAFAASLLALLFGVYGLWLVVTPDYDGGRRPVGAIVLAVTVPVFLMSAVALRRRRS